MRRKAAFNLGEFGRSLAGIAALTAVIATILGLLAMKWQPGELVFGFAVGALLGFAAMSAIAVIVFRRAQERLLAEVDSEATIRPDWVDALTSSVRPMAEIHARLKGALQREHLSASEASRTAMGRELHHRLRNSLQIMNSLINLQISYEKNDDCAGVLRQALLRCLVFGIVYRSTESEEPNATVSFSHVAGELIEQTQRIFSLPRHRPEFDCVVTIPHPETDLAIPLALVLTEMLIAVAVQPRRIDERCIIRLQEDEADHRRWVLTFASSALAELAKPVDEESSISRTLLASWTAQMQGELTFDVQQSSVICRLSIPRIGTGNQEPASALSRRL